MHAGRPHRNAVTMVAPLNVLVGGWHEFFALVGTAAATLVGLMFVAVSITAGYMTEELRPGLSVFLSPTIVNLTTILVACLALLLPTSAFVMGGILVAIGAFSAIHALRVFIGVERILREPDTTLGGDDHFFYGVAPVGCAVALFVGACFTVAQSRASVWILAAALIATLMLCIRNAWDVTVWAVIRAPNAPGQESRSE